MFVEVGVDLLQPTLMARIVDEGVLKGDMAAILSTGILMLVLSIFGGLGGLAAAGFASAASQNYGADMRNDMYRKVMSLSFSQHDRFSTGSLVTRMTNDVTQLQDFTAQALRMFFRSPLLFIGSIIMALRLNPKFGLVILAILPLEALVVWLMVSKTSPLFEIVQKRLDKLNAVIQENVIAARVVKVFVREDREVRRFNESNDSLTDMTLKVQRTMACIMPLMTILMNAAVIAVIWIGGLEVNRGAIKVGEVMAVINYLTQVMMGMMMFSMLFNSIARARASAVRVREVLSADPEIVAPGGDSPAVTAGAVSFRKVSFSYKGQEGDAVLQDIDLDIRPGETVGIMGATGTGKTSFINLIPRFYDATEGCVLVDGVDVREYDPAVLRRDISVVLQKSELFSGTVADNIRWGNDAATQEEVEAAARIAQAHDFISALPEGYDTVIGQKGSSVSGGQKQRIAIARGVLKKPRILILDDASSALDLATEGKLRRAIRENMTDMTVIIIAARVASVREADRIIVLDNGCVVGFDRHEKLLESCPVYRDIYDSQMRGGEAK
ncbi:MAG: ABC transporter ATP-binding protein [Clostridia bacterium]|nr:ABC transporter ATP-binding protein [Clostridia bacterium]